jgi:hypothetical protein
MNRRYIKKENGIQEKDTTYCIFFCRLTQSVVWLKKEGMAQKTPRPARVRAGEIELSSVVLAREF